MLFAFPQLKLKPQNKNCYISRFGIMKITTTDIPVPQEIVIRFRTTQEARSHRRQDADSRCVQHNRLVTSVQRAATHTCIHGAADLEFISHLRCGELTLRVHQTLAGVDLGNSPEPIPLRTGQFPLQLLELF